MDDKIYFIGLLIVGILGAFIGLSLVSGISSGSLSFSSPSDLFASVFAAVETDWSSNIGQVLITFDNFKNSHQEIIDKNNGTKIFDVSSYLKNNMFWMGTDHGLFLSRDGGLTWNRFNSSNNEINSQSFVFKVLPASGNGEDFFISVFSNGKGTVYQTWDYFFHLKKLMDFDGEAAYDIYRSGNYLYFGMSTGQVIRYNLLNSQTRVVNAFSSPIIKIYYPGDGNFYLLLKDGSFEKGTSLSSSFSRIKIPGGWFFGSSPAKNVAFGKGVIYILTGGGIQASYDGGETFSLLKHIPILKKQIDAIGYNNGALYVASGQNLYLSYDGGGNWNIVELNNQFKVSQFYFSGGRIILSM